MNQPKQPSDSATTEGGAPSRAPLRPGDEAAPGTPGTGEALCPRCGGSGSVDGKQCPQCSGTGRITQGVGGA